jgi:hypothetical protein
MLFRPSLVVVSQLGDEEITVRDPVYNPMLVVDSPGPIAGQCVL